MEPRDKLNGPGAADAAEGQQSATNETNPYGGEPGGGIAMPPYFKPTPSVVNGNNYYPLTEELGPDEMRVSFVGSCPFPPKRNQAGTAIVVELGNGDRFFFDFGSGCLHNIVAMQIPFQLINDIFLTHLHVDHYADLPYLYCFAPWLLRWKPLRVHGPSGRTSKDGIKAMIEGMKQMVHWHTQAFQIAPCGDGYEVEVNEFDWKDENGVCYDKNGVTVRHWRRSHQMDGCSAYRLDWNGLSFVWTGDGRPDELTVKYSKGVDVFVSEIQPDLPLLQSRRMGVPQFLGALTIDQAHTPHYATGYMMNQINPRIGMVTHFANDEPLVNEMIAGVRAHYRGLFALGVDVTVVNVTKDAIWVREAVLAESAAPRRPDLKALFGEIPEEIVFPDVPYNRDAIQEQYTRDMEIDPKKYYPKDVYREPKPDFPKGMRIPASALAGPAKK